MTMGNAPLQPGMGQCSVTGKIVPEDELVTIQGQRVCAEGKAILLARLKAGDAMPGELERPTVLRRFCCILLDVIIIGLPFGILSAILGGNKPGGHIVGGIVSLVGAIAAIVYFAAQHAARGQTVGKKAGNIRVVNNADGSPITTSQAYIREMVYGGPSVIAALVTFTGSAVITGLVGLLVGGFGLANLIVALVDRSRQRAIHDRIAGTRVVKVQ